MMKGIHLYRTAFIVITGVFSLMIAPPNLPAVTISDGPMDVLVQTAPPILMFLFDNSGSMDSELMTPEPYGLYEGAYYIFPDQAYTPENDHVYGAGHALDESTRRAWQTQWAGFNRLYYDPQRLYKPWPSTGQQAFNPSSLNRPFSDPARKNGRNCRIDLAATFYSTTAGMDEVRVLNAHYFVRTGTGNHQNTYLVTWQDANQDGALDLGGTHGDDRRRYFRFVDDGNGVVDANELITVIDESEKNAIRPVISKSSGGFERYASDREELQNFANWFSYHRRRAYAAKAAAAWLIARSEQKYIGLYAVNGNPRMAAQPVRLTSEGQDNGKLEPHDGQSLLNAIYHMSTGGNTPLRHALDRIGRYIHQELPSDMGPSPFVNPSLGGGCQRASVVVVTDGFLNGPIPVVGNSDGDDGSPYADGWAGTLADVAMHYYEHDLAPGLPDDLPPNGCDDRPYQHLTVYTISFGMPGTVMDSLESRVYRADTCLILDDQLALSWPQPRGASRPEMPGPMQTDLDQHQNPTPAIMSDGLWHTAINGRGNYLDIYFGDTTDVAFPNLLLTQDAFASSSGIAIDDVLYADQSVVYQAKYRTDDWSGEITAIDHGGKGAVLWRASEGLRPGRQKWDTRQIITFGGPWRKPQGVAFRYRDLSSDQMVALGSDLNSRSQADKRAQDLVDYIRGRDIEGLRVRASLLGDIVHATPVLFGETLFVGSNDGMLHAFNAQNGRERFAYVPNIVLPSLMKLASPSYLDHHRFYVDGPLYAGEVLVGKYERKTYLVGGLGKGGPGYYCMLVGHRERPQSGDDYGDYHWLFHVDQIDSGGSEGDVAQYIRWEYPPILPDHSDVGNAEKHVNDSDLGYSFSQAYCVNGNSPDGSYRSVVIFGNGYNSARQSAVLYVLSAESGELIRKIDTGVAQDNGLSTPALVDVNMDRRVDYAYAGDLKGNLWKFDLTASNPDQWGVAYGEDRDGDGVINASQGDIPAPLFQAEDQPITGRPDVMIMKSVCAPQAPGYIVVFGTGQYLGSPDRSDPRPQSIFGIWDFGDDSDDSEHLGSVVSRSSGLLSSGFYLVRQALENQTTNERTAHGELAIDKIDYNTVDDDGDGDGLSVNNRSGSQQADPAKYVGWVFDFPQAPESADVAAERVTGNAVIRGGKTIITSYVPDNKPCNSGGDARLYVLTCCDGALTADSNGEPMLPLQFKGRLNGHPVIIKDPTMPRIDKILTSDQQGNILTIDFLGERWGKVSWHQTIK